MPMNTRIKLPARKFVLLNTTPITAICVQPLDRVDVYLIGTAGSGTPPTDILGGRLFHFPKILMADVPLSALWPGNAGVNTVWAWAESPCSIGVSYA